LAEKRRVQINTPSLALFGQLNKETRAVREATERFPIANPARRNAEKPRRGPGAAESINDFRYCHGCIISIKFEKVNRLGRNFLTASIRLYTNKPFHA
jgi:hypothetical protein